MHGRRYPSGQSQKPEPVPEPDTPGTVGFFPSLPSLFSFFFFAAFVLIAVVAVFFSVSSYSLTKILSKTRRSWSVFGFLSSSVVRLFFFFFFCGGGWWMEIFVGLSFY